MVMTLNAAKIVKKHIRPRVQFGSIHFLNDFIWKNEEKGVFLRDKRTKQCRTILNK